MTALQRAPQHDSGARRRRLRPGYLHRFAGNLALVVAVGLLVAPLLLAIWIALTPVTSGDGGSPGWLPDLTLDNFVSAYSQMRYTQSLFNTVVILIGTSVLTVFIGSLASYPLSRITKAWSQGLYLLFFLGTAVPIWVLIAPLYLFMRDIKLLGSFVGVVLIYTALLLPVAVFFFTSFIRQIPTEVEEAAAIDGAGPLRTFFSIMFPLIRPTTIALVTFISLSVWNDLVIPLIFLRGDDSGTIMSNAYALVNPLIVQPSVLFPAILLGVLPLLVLFLLLRSHVIAGLTSGAGK